MCFLKVFGYRGFSRKPQEAQDGSQETPKETPKDGQKLVKKLLKSETKTEQNEPQTTMAYIQKIALTGAVFSDIGPSNNAYFEKKKRSQNDSKMVQDCPNWLS